MSAQSDEAETFNLVHLRGRLGAPVETRQLPSGDELVVFRLTVDRPRGERVRVDSIECSTTRRKVHSAVEKANPGDLVEVTGSLRRRFWQSPTGSVSRYSVDVRTAKLNRTGRRAAASRARTPASA